MEPFEIGALTLGGLNTAYNLYTNKRDFDYQKALQQTMFEREDTAVQRRMADLQAAGINPNLAAGSAAGAGAVVSRSNTNDVNMGSAIDMLQSVNNIRQQKQQVENAKIENQILKDQEYNLDNQKYISMAQTFSQLGIPFNTFVTRRGNEFGLKVSPNLDDGTYIFDGSSSSIKKLLDAQINSNIASSTLLQKDLDFYNYDKISEYLMPFLKLLGLGRK